MCKWEWPFVFIETKTNKYPLRTEARLFFFRKKKNVFVLFFYRKTENTAKRFVIETVHGSYLTLVK